MNTNRFLINLINSVKVLPVLCLTTACAVQFNASLDEKTQKTETTAVTHYTDLGLAPLTDTLSPNANLTFTPSGGSGSYTFSMISGSGSVTADGVYTAPSTASTEIVRVTDSITGSSVEATLTIYDGVLISPTTKSIGVNQTFTFTASGGSGTYTFSKVSGTGSINSSSGLYTAPGTAGSAVVRVTDSVTNLTSDANITIYGAVAISPTSKDIGVNLTHTFTASSGSGTYTFSKVSGTGSINSSSGLYTAPAAAGSAVVRVTDTLTGLTSDANITIHGAVAISPTTKDIGVNLTHTFTASSGSGTYTFSKVSGTGSINSSSGLYTAPAAAGSAVVRVTDTLTGLTSDANITIHGAVAISPTSKDIGVNLTHTFTASSGSGTYTFSKVSGTGSINSSSGLYTAPAAAGSAVVRVTDTLTGLTSDANITIHGAVAISPTTKDIGVNLTHTFTASSGSGTYTFSKVSGTGSINSSSGLYTAPAAAGSDVVRVTDTLTGLTADANITIHGAVAISPTTKDIGVNLTHTFTASSGSGTYTFSKVSGTGSINSSSGLYTAPAAAGSAVVRATDTLTGLTSDANITIHGAVAISPTTKDIGVNLTHTFTASSGSGTYTFSKVSGTGSINSSSGLYTAPAAAGSDVVRVTDTLTGLTADANITIYGAVAISPTTKTLAVGNSFTFSAGSGSGTYVFSVASGTGTINSSSGLYTAPGSATTETVRVTDSLTGLTSDATVTVNAALGISPSSASVGLSATKTFAGSNGVSPYTYSVTSGEGSINSSSGVYTGPSSIGTGVANVRVTDNVGNTANASVTLFAAGALDTTFDTDGLKYVNVSGVDYMCYAGVQSDGKIVGIGTYNNLSGTAVVRLTSAGALDTTFDSDGIMTSAALGADTRTGTIDSNGKIYTIGFDGANGRDFIIGRITTAGAMDTTWDGDGKVTTDFTGGGSLDEGKGIVVQSDGKVIAVGNVGNNFGIARYTSTGALDTTFDTDGKTTTDFGGTDMAWHVMIDSNGKYVVVGQGIAGQNEFAVARYNTDGSLDTTFDTDGKATVSVTAGDDVAYGGTIDSNGKIIVVGWTYNGGDIAWGLARFNSNGSLDTSFGTSGKKTLNLSGTMDWASRVYVQADGKIVVAGIQSSSELYAIARLDANGTALDTTFDGDGIMSPAANFYGEAYGVGLAVDASGYYILGGFYTNANMDFGFARILAP